MLLTREIAESFLANPTFVWLNEFHSIEDAAEEVIGKYSGWSIELNGLKSLSETAAEGLSTHQGAILVELVCFPGQDATVAWFYREY